MSIGQEPTIQNPTLNPSQQPGTEPVDPNRTPGDDLNHVDHEKVTGDMPPAIANRLSTQETQPINMPAGVGRAAIGNAPAAPDAAPAAPDAAPAAPDAAPAAPAVANQPRFTKRQRVGAAAVAFLALGGAVLLGRSLTSGDSDNSTAPVAAASSAPGTVHDITTAPASPETQLPDVGPQLQKYVIDPTAAAKDPKSYFEGFAAGIGMKPGIITQAEDAELRKQMLEDGDMYRSGEIVTAIHGDNMSAYINTLVANKNAGTTLTPAEQNAMEATLLSYFMAEQPTKETSPGYSLKEALDAYAADATTPVKVVVHSYVYDPEYQDEFIGLEISNLDSETGEVLPNSTTVRVEHIAVPQTGNFANGLAPTDQDQLLIG